MPKFDITLKFVLFYVKFPQTTSKVDTRTFQGCLSGLTYQSQVQSLWTQILNDGRSTTCCQAPPSLPSEPTIPGASFTGFSHLVLQAPATFTFSQLTRMSFEIRPTFTECTVFIVLSSNGQDKFSIGLKEGNVEWKVVVNGAEHTVLSNNKYIDAVWMKVRDLLNY